MVLSLDEALGMSLTDETDESIHVDIDTRQVTIPESQQVFGVESDEDVEVKHIVIDGRYNDGTDLSTFTFRVNYQNANGDKGTYLATELKVNDDSIEFDWVIGRQVVAYKGTIAFIVCAYTIDSSSVIQNEWNSTLGKGTVLEGLEVSEFDFGDDIVRQLASILSDVNAAQASAKASADEAYKSKTEVVALGKEQQAAIEKKGKDTLATIPEDYTQVSNDVSQLKEDTAKLKDGKISKFYASSQGDTNLPDSDDGRIMDLKLYGKSEQKQYSGKNLLNATLQTTTENGATCTNNGDGTYTVNGTAPDGVNAYFPIVKSLTVKAGKKYKLVGCPAGGDMNAKYALFYRDNWRVDIGNGSTFTQAEDATDYVSIKICGGFTANNLVFKPMLVDADTYPDTSYNDYEPYVGGIPSPNPDYPQEIKSVVNPVVKVIGKNLLKTINWETQTVSGVTIEKTSDTVFKISGTATGDVTFNSSWGQNIKVPAQSYLLCKILNGSCPVGSEVIFFTASYNSITSEIGGISPPQRSAISCGLVRFNIKEGSNINCTVGLSLQMDTSTDYQPYTEQTATLPYTLNAIPVSSGGNVTIDGQQYVADYVDVERGKLVRMTARKNLFDLNIWPWGDPTETRADFQADIERYDSGTFKHRSIPCLISSLSDDSKIGFPSFRYSTTGDSGWNGYAKLGIYVSKDYDTVDKLKSYLGEDTVILYQLKDPTETDLTADEIAAFKSLVSYYPVTNVSTTSDQLDGYTVFNYPISLANGWNYVKQQLGDTRDYLYGIDLMTAEAYVNSEYAAALAEIEV